MRTATVKSPGNPDKVCDLVVEAVVDEYLRRDPETRIRLHASGGKGALFLSGDVKSKADFDVAAIVRKRLGALGVMSDIEPFISIEQVSPEQSSNFMNGSEVPVMVSGYATSETPDMIPLPLLQAKLLAKELHEKRQADENWFWLGPDAAVTVMDGVNGTMEVSLSVEHGSKTLDEARETIGSHVRAIMCDAKVKVNESGPSETRGLAERMGSSGRDVAPYGESMPCMYTGSGVDPWQAEKAGAWLVRAAARSLVTRGAKAALVRALYRPGDKKPSVIFARDERGKDLSADISKESLSLDRVMKEWYRPDLCHDAAMWGFAGEASMPWED